MCIDACEYLLYCKIETINWDACRTALTKSIRAKKLAIVKWLLVVPSIGISDKEIFENSFKFFFRKSQPRDSSTITE